MNDYGILASESGEGLVQMVNEEIRHGYRPIGGVQVVVDKSDDLIFYQAVIREPPAAVSITHSGYVTKEVVEGIRKAVEQEIINRTGRI